MENENKTLTATQKMILNNDLTNAGLKIMANADLFPADDVQAFINAIINLQKSLNK
jgi:hypothetical protein